MSDETGSISPLTSHVSRLTFPSRIVCLTAESTEIVYALGAGDRVVGVSGFSVFPEEARAKPRIGGYTGIRAERVLSLSPDLVLAHSDLQADVTAELVKEGATVFHLNQRSLSGILDAILLIGRVIGKAEAAERLRGEMEREILKYRERPPVRRPRVYFEEWNDPLICGIGWVSDLIEAAGGEDLFRERAASRAASGRVVEPEEVVERDPEIIFASWCGKRVSFDRLRARPGWEKIRAVREGNLVEIKAPYILQPGPSVLRGLRRMHEAIRGYTENRVSSIGGRKPVR
jgi:iron complex transport system substrate-binding protein